MNKLHCKKKKKDEVREKREERNLCTHIKKRTCTSDDTGDCGDMLALSLSC